MEKEIDKVKTQKTKDTKTEIMVGGVKFNEKITANSSSI